jgi:dienelactone hydrolase
MWLPEHRAHPVNRASAYAPFVRGRHPVGVCTTQAFDSARGRRFALEAWYPAAARHCGEDLAYETQDVFTPPGASSPFRQMAVRDAQPCDREFPLIVFSHPSASHRRCATYLCTHLCSHGYVVAALDHSETVAADLARKPGETAEQTAARVQRIIDSRVPDVRFLLDGLFAESTIDLRGARFDRARIGLVGHSFGGWTALVAAQVDERVATVVAIAPGGASRSRPGILPLRLAFTAPRPIPILYLVAEDDATLPLDGMVEIHDRTPSPKRMVGLYRADHYHFMDRAAEIHEAVRSMTDVGELSWVREMRAFDDLCTEALAHEFVRGLALCHLDAVLKGDRAAEGFMKVGLAPALAARGTPARIHEAARPAV